jgi:hypothetical protein
MAQRVGELRVGVSLAGVIGFTRAKHRPSVVIEPSSVGHGTVVVAI